jgi:U3 small nucleolar RNA-associated protein 11
VHIVQRNEQFDAETLSLLNTQDHNYIAHQRSVNARKLERLKSNIQLLPGGDEQDGEQEEEEEELMMLDGGSSNKARKKRRATTGPKHTIFVADTKAAKNFDAAKHFDTLPELVPMAHNRLTTEALMQAPLPTPDPHLVLVCFFSLQAPL